ncbi:hypothetical protein IEQ34_021753 [Dendrobium chrysotoxum]|uniref:Cystatin domain-containing protein n=1 Tax=Dendrobium chrysotoxum TaxID=161865 RepID=A0AAV7G3W5_DENCH|nr:hypothetical protein IEQ34_021753 [Dendrobium chrysotoxum]
MAFTHNIILLFSAIALLYHISITTAQVPSTAGPPTAAPPSGNGDDIEVIKDVKNNRDIQELGMFAVEKQNLKESLPSSISFIEVVRARRWPVDDGFMYFLNINSKKKVNDVEVEGSFFAYVNVKAGDRTLKTGIFQATNE